MELRFSPGDSVIIIIIIIYTSSIKLISVCDLTIMVTYIFIANEKVVRW